MIMAHLKTCRFGLARASRFLCLILLICLLRSMLFSLSREQIFIGLESIQSTRIQATLGFLASEHFKGRGTGTPEAGLTAAYIASVFQRNGLKPLEGNHEGFVQVFDLCQALPKEQSLLELEDSEGGNKGAFKFREDFLPAAWGPGCRASYADAVFAGYGISAKDLRYDDYGDLDVSGHIVVVLNKVPDNSQAAFDKLSPADYEDPMAKVLLAQRLGATGVLIIL